MTDPYRVVRLGSVDDLRSRELYDTAPLAELTHHQLNFTEFLIGEFGDVADAPKPHQVAIAAPMLYALVLHGAHLFQALKGDDLDTARTAVKEIECTLERFQQP